MKNKTRHTFTRKVAYIATKGYIRVITTKKEYAEAKEVNSTHDIASEEYYKAMVKLENGYRLYVFNSFYSAADGGEGPILQFRNEVDVAKSMLEFIHIIFMHVYEDYTALSLAPRKDHILSNDREVIEKERYNPINKKDPGYTPPPKLSPEYSDASKVIFTYDNSTHVSVYQGKEYLGYMVFGLKNKRVGWHTYVSRCKDMYRPEWPACFNTLDAAKEKVRKEHSPKMA